MDFCLGDKIKVYEEDREKCYDVEEITEEYVKLTNSISFHFNESIEQKGEPVYFVAPDEENKGEKEVMIHQVINKMHEVKDISYQKAVKILEILMDVDNEL